MSESSNTTSEPETIEAFARRADAWLQEAVPAVWRENRGALSGTESDAIRREWDRQLWRGGFAGIPFPREFGGQGLGLAEDVVFHILAAKAQAPDGFSRVGKTLVAPMLVRSGSEVQRERYLPPLLRGEEVWCQGFSEPDAGSDLAGVRTRARRVKDGYRLTGRKTWTTFAQHADFIFVLAVTDPAAPRYRNLSMFLVDMRAEGVVVEDIRQISGVAHFAETQFEGAFVPESDRVGGEGDGWRIAMELLSDERGGSETAARYVEIRSDVDLLLESVGDRSDLARELEELEVRTEVLRWQLGKVVDLDDRDPGEEYWRAVSTLKVQWSELWQDVTRFGVEHGLPDHRDHWRYQYLESRAVSIFSGTNEIQRNIISERILGLPR
ncbi:acyl-CoA dehydrogenase family protein [Leucobacter weissii]|uniref:Acyl-CoA dehydrogenase family protein n=1 Tax=Leucobacter weissii TaxID=1983706 RepID=A0A939SBJ7_9MICO|nr:acyl-CoA dehydrogenase family protein [Leucobacter weissii]MBO1901438.1 acyl-CoA dehydrogenase family protein [Leucobacter weissii]